MACRYDDHGAGRRKAWADMELMWAAGSKCWKKLSAKQRKAVTDENRAVYMLYKQTGIPTGARHVYPERHFMDQMTRFACKLCRLAEAAGKLKCLTPEQLEWFEQHKLDDARREEEERAEAEHDRMQEVWTALLDRVKHRSGPITLTEEEERLILSEYLEFD